MNSQKNESSHFIVPLKFYIGTLIALIVLTFITVITFKYIRFGNLFDIVLALVIATVKAGLVISFFMNLFWDRGYFLIFLLVSIFFVLMFISMMIFDDSYRNSFIKDESIRYGHEEVVKFKEGNKEE